MITTQGHMTTFHVHTPVFVWSLLLPHLAPPLWWGDQVSSKVAKQGPEGSLEHHQGPQRAGWSVWLQEAAGLCQGGAGGENQQRKVGLSQEARVLFPPPLHTGTYTLAPRLPGPVPSEVLPSDPPLPQSRQQVLKQPLPGGRTSPPHGCPRPQLSLEPLPFPLGPAFGASVCVFSV